MSTKPQRKIELFSGTYFGACTLGGIIGKSASFSNLTKRTSSNKTPSTQPAVPPTPP